MDEFCASHGLPVDAFVQLLRRFRADPHRAMHAERMRQCAERFLRLHVHKVADVQRVMHELSSDSDLWLLGAGNVDVPAALWLS